MTKVDTDTFLRERAPYQEYSEPFQHPVLKIAHFQQNHPTIVKVACVFLFALSIATLIALPCLRPLIGKWTLYTFLPLASLTLVISLVSSLLFLRLYFVFPPFHDPNVRAFEERSVNRPEEGLVGELKYVDTLPTLRIRTGDNPKNCGKSYGYLVAQEMSSLIRIFRILIFRVGPLFGFGMPKPEKVQAHLAKIKHQIKDTFPEYLEEMEGVVEGYNLWCQENRVNRPITVDELLMYHLIPEAMQFRFDKLSNPKAPMGCTALVVKDEKKGNVFARNLDWESYGLTGTYSLALIIERQKGLSTMEITIPGLRGLSMMNEQGFCAAMNVAPPEKWTEKIEGPPALFFLRNLVDHFSSVKEALPIVKEKRPLAPFHLTLVDEKDAAACHLLQRNMRSEPNEKHIIDKLDPKMSPYLCTTNALCTKKGRGRIEMFNSAERERKIFALFADAEVKVASPKYGKIAKYAIGQVTFVANNETTHSIMFYPSKRKVGVRVNNSYATRFPETKLTQEFLFRYPKQRVV